MTENTNCKCETRKTERPEDTVKSLRNRLKRINGQINGMIKMIDNGAYCADILIQSAAVSAAINGFNKALFADHMRNCVTRDIREGKYESTEEMIKIVHKLMK